MANTYTQIHIQVVFAVQNRESLITNHWKEELFKYITAIVQNNGHKMLQINGMPDHVHALIGLRPGQSLADLMKQVKQNTSQWINKKGFASGKFSWQAGYGAFSYSRSDVPAVIKYIQDQQKHHASNSFREEYLQLLREFELDFDEHFVFKPID